MKIIRVTAEDITPLKKKAISAGLCFSKSTVYWGGYIDDKIVGMAGVQFYTNKAILKNAFVLDEYRGMGIFAALNSQRWEEIKRRGLKVVELTATPCTQPIWEQSGATLIKKYKTFAKYRVYV